MKEIISAKQKKREREYKELHSYPDFAVKANYVFICSLYVFLALLLVSMVFCACDYFFPYSATAKFYNAYSWLFMIIFFTVGSSEYLLKMYLRYNYKKLGEKNQIINEAVSACLDEKLRPLPLTKGISEADDIFTQKKSK